MWLRYFTVLYAAAVVMVAYAEVTCGKGEFFGPANGGQQICYPCPRGKFMSLDHHKKTTCAYCSKAKTLLHEVLLQTCTPVSDAVIGCQKGYFRDNRKQFGLKLYGECQKRTDAKFSCPKGKYLSDGNLGIVKCLPCSDGRFISLNSHTLRKCESCSKADKEAYEMILEKCTPTSDAVIGCSKGYFRLDRYQLGMRIYGKCLKNTTEKIKCGRGQYLARMNDQQNFCLPCPYGTFLSENSHLNKNCVKCKRTDHSSHEITLKPCTSISDTVIGCDQGYHRVQPNEPCQKVEETCGKGKFLSEAEDGKHICRPCPHGTFISEDDHKNKDCTSCTKAEFDLHEIELEKCTPTSDAVIGCEAGYVRRNLFHFEIGMQLYGECEIGEDVTSCGKGKYLGTTKTGRKSCLPCPAGQFNLMENHTNENCANCSLPEAFLHEIILKPCTTTSDTIIGCDQGYLRVQPNEPCQKVEAEACGKGKFLSEVENGKHICRPCPQGTFISEDDHKYKDCASCTRAESYLHEIELQKCTSTSDAVIGCEAGYVRQNLFHFEIGMKLYGECVIGEDVTSCGKGEYLGTTKTGRKFCLPCPAGHFNLMENHTNENCAECSLPEVFLHEINHEPCTPTSDTVIGCETGYYRKKSAMSGQKLYGECEKCTFCKHCTLKPCDMFTDTVCCSEPTSGHSD